MTAPKLGGHAAVLGAGMAGLLTARVLSEFYQTVTLVERDSLPRVPLQRKGIPQGRHLHGLLSRGSRIFEELFPGILAELVASGAHVLDDGDLSRVYTRIGTYGLNRWQQFTDPAALVLYLASRPFVEFHVRRRVAALGNVKILDGHDVVEPIADATGRITGVRVVDRDGGAAVAVDADLVVDAMGRAARTPSFLAQHGYGRPAEQRSTAHATYSSQLLCIPDGRLDEKLMMVVQPGQGNPRCALQAHEDGQWILTVGRLADDRDPPTELAGMLALAEQVVPPAILSVLRSAEPVGEVAVYRYRGAVWRRYDRMPRVPSGLLVTGDALCSLNPIYGQGVTMAGLQALTLRDHLRRGLVGEPALFFSAAAQLIGPVWDMNEANDRAQSQSRQRLSGRLTNWTLNRAMKAAENDIVLTETFYRVTNLVDPPARLQSPALIPRMVIGNFRRSRTRLHA